MTTNAIAPFVWLNVMNIPGRFSDNGFLLVHEFTDVQFFSKKNVTLQDILKNFSIESLKDVC